MPSNAEQCRAILSNVKQYQAILPKPKEASQPSEEKGKQQIWWQQEDKNFASDWFLKLPRAKARQLKRPKKGYLDLAFEGHDWI